MTEIASAWLAKRPPRAGVVLVEGGAAASDALAAAVVGAGDALGGLTFAGIQVPGVNRANWLPNDRAKFETFFMTPDWQPAPTRSALFRFPIHKSFGAFEVVR